MKHFYVLYDPASRKYLDDEGQLDGFEHACKFNQPSPTTLQVFKSELPELRYVGPCEEGEEP